MQVLTVENLAKKYHRESGGRNVSSFRELVSASARKLFKWPGVAQDRQERQEFWALRGVSFSLDEGVRLGVIGRNGAGKSTLLKLLSRITEPTEGRMVINGRTASLLEIGTGFHPDLTGRENVYLNGALLGMSRREIERKLEQIVEFAEIEQSLDEPVKHYSSGMYVRLAFSIAAHVDPDILILDEVLAVGDVQFQRKCFGKIGELGKTARSVIFVSHDLTAISSLCDRCILLRSGRVAFDGTPSEAIQNYYAETGIFATDADGRDAGRRIGDAHAELVGVEVRTLEGKPTIEVNISDSFRVAMRYRLLDDLGAPAVPNYHFYRADGVCAFIAQAASVKPLPRGVYLAEVVIPGHMLNEGAYSIGFALTTYFRGHFEVNFYERNAVIVNIRDPRDDDSLRYGYAGEFLGVIRPRFNWKIQRLEQ